MHMGRKEFTRPFYPGSSRRTGGSNDGLAPVYSQMYPRAAGRHPVGGVIDDAAGFRRGRWYHQLLDDVDHIDIVALPSSIRSAGRRPSPTTCTTDWPPYDDGAA